MSFFRKLKTAPEVYPLIAIVSGACGLAVFFGGRAALKSPDVSWDHKHNPHPWLHVKPNEQIKLHSNYDMSKLTSDRPSDV